MITISIQIVVLLASLIQSGSTLPIRTGDVARQLYEQDVAAIEQVLPSASKPWLLNGSTTQTTRAHFIPAYLAPTTATAALRRGLVISVVRGISPPAAWVAQPAESYAQVAIPGRNFDQIQGDRDINQPFRIVGSFDDTEVIRLIDFLRSNPSVQGGRSAGIEPWPILSVTRQADKTIAVRSRGPRGDVMEGERITLQQDGQGWIILQAGMWIA